MTVYFSLKRKIEIKTLSKKVYKLIKKSLEKFVNEKITIKLPNDLLIKGSKVCGILQETINYTDHTAVIFNLLEYHNATNETNDYRFHCQFSTDIPFNEIVDLYDKGKLFKLN